MYYYGALLYIYYYLLLAVYKLRASVYLLMLRYIKLLSPYNDNDIFKYLSVFAVFNEASV